MKAAFAVWKNRIAPLFDVARQIHMVESDQGIIKAQTRASIDDQIAAHKKRQLAEMEIETLECGAISRFMLNMVTAHGIELFAFIKVDKAVNQNHQKPNLNAVHPQKAIPFLGGQE